ncbi:apoptosis regulatory protein Siva [Microcaecilia unicolor]|uniref:Apoptosis regulatory protein Siva n=1 Tax=Microcaecilia unicolor TaxID=1415580 RepID=A0A6P7Z670_9AMPH|nr:apoptosis regulatory protein Siva [Microcaecilia unicolor]
MPKRSYPFGDVAPSQLKTRVGLKELCEGVFGEMYKREVFEKTKRLLFSGAQAYMDGIWSGHGNGGAAPGAVVVAAAGGRGGHGLLHGQTRIGRDGRLLRGPPAPAGDAILPVGVSKACSSCIRSVGEKEACSQCERFVCQNCRKLCSCCNRSTCSFCSVDESGLGESILCYNCSMYEI